MILALFLKSNTALLRPQQIQFQTQKMSKTISFTEKGDNLLSPTLENNSFPFFCSVLRIPSIQTFPFKQLTNQRIVQAY